MKSTETKLNLCEDHGLPIIKTGGNCEPLCQKCLGLSDRDAAEMLGLYSRAVKRTKQKNSFSKRLRASFAKKNQKEVCLFKNESCGNCPGGDEEQSICE